MRGWAWVRMYFYSLPSSVFTGPPCQGHTWPGQGSPQMSCWHSSLEEIWCRVLSSWNVNVDWLGHLVHFTIIFLFISTDKQRQERYYSFIPRSEPAIRVDVKNVGCPKCTDFITLSKVIQKIFFRRGRGWSQVAISWSTGQCWRRVVIMFCVKITARQIVRHHNWLS